MKFLVHSSIFNVQVGSTCSRFLYTAVNPSTFLTLSYWKRLLFESIYLLGCFCPSTWGVHGGTRLMIIICDNDGYF